MPRILVEPFTIASESIDMNGHVNNQEYVRWMQDIATAHSHEQGWTLARYLDTRTTWIIRSHYIEYIRPAFMGDDLMVATWVAGMAAQTSPRKYRFLRARDGKTIVEAESLWVYCDATSGRPLAILPDYERAYELRFVCLRYFNAAGAQPDGSLGERHNPEMHLIPLAINTALSLSPELKVFGNDYPTTDGTCVRDYIHVCDVAAVHLLALQHLLSGEQSLKLNHWKWVRLQCPRGY